MQGDINFCQRCGHRLSEKIVEGTARPFCESCEHVVFLDPKVAAVVLVTCGDKLVLVRRGIDPAMGRWSFPAGFVDRGETVEDAAKREVMEETGLTIGLDGLVGVYSSHDSPVVLVVYSATVLGGALRAGHDATDVRLLPPDELPDLPFPQDGRILNDWTAMARREADSRPERKELTCDTTP